MMNFIDSEVIQRELEEKRKEIERYRVEKLALRRKRREGKILAFWAIFFSLSN